MAEHDASQPEPQPVRAQREAIDLGIAHVIDDNYTSP